MSRRPYKGRDHYGKKAREDGYEARSAYKLEEIDRRHQVTAPGQRVVDLGCFPGSWSQYTLSRIGSKGHLVGVDLGTPAVSGGTWLERSVYEVTPEELLETLGGPADLVLSDMAPRTTGNRLHDHVAQIALARRALELARSILRPGGYFVVKVFEGEDAPDFAEEVRLAFDKLKRIKPKATRTVSREIFFLGLGHRPAEDAEDAAPSG